jgi:hypothetical protein
MLQRAEKSRDCLIDEAIQLGVREAAPSDVVLSSGLNIAQSESILKLLEKPSVLNPQVR